MSLKIYSVDTNHVIWLNRNCGLNMIEHSIKAMKKIKYENYKK